ncbi:hypothetical protein PG911_07175 [Tenacibaculum ovolyticum]|uniref:hypothetical protein n=1 Tax=Tenacibaculum ovolyticum TaxID=104270 RepID=UPI0022F3B187|nr:hypothetical protein [Tenacibaculum ovolyticum]WBX78030.1 hypothetical protein PG911_07175 [Tenacibaculum ovolyticum]
MKRSILFILVAIFFFTTNACKKENASEVVLETAKQIEVKKKNSNLNISILLDLSDRIDPEKYPKESMELFQRDIGYIELIAKNFENYIRNKKSKDIQDKIQLFLDPEPADKALNQKISDLKISFDKTNATKELILETSKKYTKTCTAIYEQAISDGKYVGSDTWGFFKNKIEDYCIDEDYRNIVVILTDGYIYHRDNIRKEKNSTTYLTPETIKGFNLRTSKWKKKFDEKELGFLPIDQNLENLEVLVLSINPDTRNPYEEDVMKEYWKKWLTTMNVKKFELKRTDLPSHIDKIIKKFLFK